MQNEPLNSQFEQDLQDGIQSSRETYLFLLQGHAAMIQAYKLEDKMAPEWGKYSYAQVRKMDLSSLRIYEGVINAKLFSLLNTELFSYGKHHE